MDDGYGAPASAATDTTTPAVAGPSNAVLAVTWSAPISLFLGAIFIGLAAAPWPAPGQQWILSRRRLLWWAAIALYGLYIAVIVFYPSPLRELSTLSPISLYAVAGLTICIYAGAAVYFWGAFRKHGRLSEGGLAVASGLLAEAVLSMAIMPLWHASWWLYHVLMAVAFICALGAVMVEYERVRHFDLKHYFAGLGIIVTVLLAMLAGELATQLFAPLVDASAINQLRWGTSGLFIGMAALMLGVLYQVVRRGDQLLRDNAAMVQKQLAALERASMVEATLRALSAALDARDRETEGHSQRVTTYALHLAQALGERDPATLESLEWGALLHDVGKIGVPDAILLKPGKLNEEEWQEMRRHPDTGYAILRDIAFLRRALDVVLHHHERWDGAGYPRQTGRRNDPARRAHICRGRHAGRHHDDAPVPGGTVVCRSARRDLAPPRAAVRSRGGGRLRPHPRRRVANAGDEGHPELRHTLEPGFRAVRRGCGRPVWRRRGPGRRGPAARAGRRSPRVRPRPR